MVLGTTITPVKRGDFIPNYYHHYFRSFQANVAIVQQSNVKNVHLVPGSGI